MFKFYQYCSLLIVSTVIFSGCGGTDSGSGSSTPQSPPISSASNSSIITTSSIPNSSAPAMQAAPQKYIEMCAACHGADGIRSSNPNATPLDRSIVSKYGKFERVTVSRMPPSNIGGCDNACAVEIKNWIIATNNLTEAPALVSSSSAAPAEPDARFVSFLAVNVGGKDVIGASGTQYRTDTGFTGGDTASQEGVFPQVHNTKEDAVFFTERYGESQYSLAVPNGFYNVEMGFIELIAEQKAGARIFNVAIEGDIKLTNVDPVGETGAARTALIKEVVNVEVKDGKIDIALQAVTFNPSISFINIKRAETAKDQYVRMCSSCHGDADGNNRSELGDSLVASRCLSCGSRAGLISRIADTMPFQFSTACVGECAEGIADYILNNFAGYNGKPDVNLPDFLNKGGNVGACGPADVEYSAIRRVARVDYNRMIKDLFKLEGSFTNGFSADQLVGSFSINGSDPVAPGQVRQYFDAATLVADKAVNNKTTWLTCNAQTDACVGQVIDDIGRKAFRRPVTTAEKDRLMSVFTAAKQADTFDRGLSALIQSILTVPQFLYYVEQGTGSGQVKTLTQYELAARMALFLWRSLPDNTLLDLAKNNQLQSDAQISAQVKRMLSDNRARDVVSLFHTQWMQISNPRQGTEGFAEQQAAVEDFTRTVEAITFGDLDLNGDGQNEEGSYKDLFTVDFAFLNADSKSLYDVSGSAIQPGADGFDLYKVGSGRRHGLLTRAPFLRSNHSPTTRGLFLRKHVLCGVIPSPPPTAADADQATDDALNPRELFAKHTQDPGCGGCHALMDPLGFPLDNYDAKGKWRTEYGGNFPVDASGNFLLTDIDGPFTGAQSMQTKLAQSTQAQECYSYNWFQFAVGRTPGTKDTCSLGQINQESGASIQDVMTSIVLSDSFRNRRAAP